MATGYKRVIRIAEKISLANAFCIISVLCLVTPAWAREFRYSGEEAEIYVQPGEPTQVNFPEKIVGGYKRKDSTVELQRRDNFVVFFAQPELPSNGEVVILVAEDKRTYSLRLKPASPKNLRDESVQIVDQRRPEGTEEEDEESPRKAQGFAPANHVSGLMREMTLVAEFGKKRGITGYRRSNRYSGEVILHDGSVEAKIDEIFMGSNLWGYVITITNLLDTNQRINPATFRLAGTQAVSAERWELAPRPATAEQMTANAHVARIYIVTKAAR